MTLQDLISYQLLKIQFDPNAQLAFLNAYAANPVAALQSAAALMTSDNNTEIKNYTQLMTELQAINAAIAALDIPSFVNNQDQLSQANQQPQEVLSLLR